MKKKLFFAAVAIVALASCSSEEIIGDSPTPNPNSGIENGIVFSSASKATTRGDIYGAAAADLLGTEFIVTGVKGDGTGTAQSNVFTSYTVDWATNTAGKTESNTSNWDYVGKTHHFGLITGPQSIKYWDYSTTAYDFAAYSVGKGNTLTPKTIAEMTADGATAPSSGVIFASPINYANAGSGAYMLWGSRDDLTKCYITDMTTVPHANYNQEVDLKFRSLASKVRMAIYETIPGYSVKEVKFYSTDQGSTITSANYATSTDATLFGTGAFYTSGKYTITFPAIGSPYAAGGTYAIDATHPNTDYNKAHVAISGSGAVNTQAFGGLNYTNGESALASTSGFLQRSSNNPSFAGTTSPYYVTVLPNEVGTILEMCVDYTLVSNDGSGETITIHGAKAFVPQVYSKWMPNYAYTYIFKISDNTNGFTNPDGTDPAGLYPITLDAVVLDSEQTGHQTTITTVATPSITTYQKGHVYSASDEYVAGDIYVRVMNNNTPLADLNHQTSSVDDKSFFYSLNKQATEAEVMDALNIRESTSSGTITGLNTLVLTPGTIDNTVEAIPGEDNNNISVAAGTTAKVTVASPTSPATEAYYAYVYQVSTGTPADAFTAETLIGASAPGDFTSYYKDAAGTTACTAADWVSGNTYYKKAYTNLNNVYAVKVIKVQ